MTAEFCFVHRANLCGCPAKRYSDPTTGQTVRVIPADQRTVVGGLPFPERPMRVQRGLIEDIRPGDETAMRGIVGTVVRNEPVREMPGYHKITIRTEWSGDVSDVRKSRAHALYMR